MIGDLPFMINDKRNEAFTFKRYGSYDVSGIANIIKDFDEEWEVITFRQKNPVHKDTKSCFLYETSIHWQEGNEYIVEKRLENEKLSALVEPIVEDLEKLHNGKRGQVVFIKSDSNTKVEKHIDGGDYLMKVRRHHIPIFTDDGVIFGVDKDEVHMNVGECWEVNNGKPHYVHNDSTSTRIHLLIDIMPGII